VIPRHSPKFEIAPAGIFMFSYRSRAGRRTALILELDYFIASLCDRDEISCVSLRFWYS